jgi:LPPG:FO 2-phospho-L-lactate transferase
MRRDRVMALSGGIGGAKLALGLSRILPPEELMIVANTGDDFEHLGLSISPDLDTLMYTLAGLDNPETGWGRRDESWNFMAALAALGGPDWFRLGDGDLATHIERTRRLRGGETLSTITTSLCAHLGIKPRLVPMSGDRVRTRGRTAEGWLDFQDYFVRLACRPDVSAIAFAGVETAQPQPDFRAALSDPRLRAVIICPSNPFISIEPILALPGMRDALRATPAPVIAVSPLIGGRAVKGPTAKMMRELGIEVSAVAVAKRYGDVIDGFIVDHSDEGSTAALDIPIFPAHALMQTLADREALARVALVAADRLAASAS